MKDLLQNLKIRNPIAKELADPQYKHVVHKTKSEQLKKQLLREANQEIKEYLRGTRAI